MKKRFAGSSEDHPSEDTSHLGQKPGGKHATDVKSVLHVTGWRKENQKVKGTRAKLATKPGAMLDTWLEAIRAVRVDDKS